MGDYVDKLSIPNAAIPVVQPVQPNEAHYNMSLPFSSTWPIVTARLNESEAIAEEFRQLLIGDDGYLSNLAAIIDEFPKDDLADIEYDEVLPVGLQSLLAFFETSFSETFTNAIIARLTTDLASGSTGLDATVEADIWAREISRQEDEEDEIQEELEEYFSFSAFELPTGAYTDAIQTHSNKRSARLLDTNQKIAIDQAELAQKNSQFAITSSLQLNKMLRDFTIDRDKTALEGKKAVAAHILQAWSMYQKEAESVLDAAKAASQITIEGYKAEYALRADVAKALTAAVMQAFTSIYGSVNVSAGLSSSGSESLSKSISVSESKSHSTSVSSSGSVTIGISNSLSERYGGDDE